MADARATPALLADAPWPVADPELARDEQVTIAVQVNGKLRGTVELPRDAAARDAEEAALALPQVATLLDGRRRARSSSCRTGSSAWSPEACVA